MEDIDDSLNVEVEPIGLGCSLEKFTESQEINDLIENLKAPNADVKKYEKEYERFKYIIGLYKEQPHLIFPYLSSLLDKTINIVKNRKFEMPVKHKAFRYMHLITNVAGYKVVVQYLPHSAGDLEPVLQLLEFQDKFDTGTWETRYCLILWLSIIVKIPFHMSRLEYSEGIGHKTLSERIIDLCKQYLMLRDSCRPAAAILCAHFFTRSDIKELYLKDFLNWTCQVVKDKSVEVDNIGVLGALAAIMKLGKREDVLPYASDLLKNILSMEWKNEPYRLSRKFAIKVIQRIGLAFLKPRVVSWRYQRGYRSITENLARISSAGDYLKTEDAMPETVDDHVDLPPQIEEVIEELIQALKDPDLTVRWCGAKGLGRITGRLNKDLGDEVVGCVLDLLKPREGESAWHGGCLALAELGKRGLLLPGRLDEVMPVLKRALVYDEPRGFASVGAIVRDAACYVAWAFARAYDIQVLKPYVNDLANALVIAACFDREINIRRAASAAFQEHIGRQGTFPHGIEILTTADYFSVAVRSNSYLNISVSIAQYSEYTNSLIDHLVDRKIEHWDVAIRELSSQALHNLTQHGPKYMLDSVLPKLLQKTTSIDVNVRHGSIMSIGEIIHALAILKIPPGEALQSEVRDLVGKLRERHQFRGLSGELMKTAAAHLIWKSSLAQLPFESIEKLSDWQWLVDECLCHEVVGVRVKAGQALAALSQNYYQENAEFSKALVKRYASGLMSNEELTRLGHTLALGSLPAGTLGPSVDEVVENLVKCSCITPATEKWVESRRQAIRALSTISSTLGFSKEKSSCRKHVGTIMECMVQGLEDYTTDDRGDTGAWVREASLSSLQTVILGVLKDDVSLLKEDLVRRAMCGIVQQAVERIDRTRFLAASVFTTILHNDVLYVAEKETLLLIFPEKGVQESWLTSYEMFPKFVLLMPLTVYSYNLLQGFIISIGGLTESLVKSASKCLFSWLADQKFEEKERICTLIIEIFRNNIKEDRLTQPVGNFLELLMSNGCVKDVLTSPSSQFALDILSLTKQAFSNSAMKFKLFSSINIYCQLIQVKGSTARQAISKLMLLICHKFGWVRKAASQNLYESLMIFGDSLCSSEEALDEALSILSDTEWAVTPILELRPIRNKLCTLLNVPPPVLVSKT